MLQAVFIKMKSRYFLIYNFMPFSNAEKFSKLFSALFTKLKVPFIQHLNPATRLV